MITLSLLHPVHKNPVQHWTFEEESVIRIGRSTENDVVLYSAVVSRHHVELRQTPSGWEIINLGTNGTYLEGKRISQVAAQDGTVIRLARSGPNVQINIGSGSSETVKALMRLRAEAAAAQQAKEQSTTVKDLVKDKPARPAEETLTPSKLDIEKPHSKSWTYMEEE
ncbi:MAG: FHA domain-containing protein [Leptolyngbyaceae cyanobacterium]